jgi:hypothetical protein
MLPVFERYMVAVRADAEIFARVTTVPIEYLALGSPCTTGLGAVLSFQRNICSRCAVKHLVSAVLCRS